MERILNWFLPIVFATSLIPQTEPNLSPYNAPFTPIPQEVVTIPIEEEKAPEIAESSEIQPVKEECSCVLYIKSKGILLPRLIDAKNLDIPFNSVPIKGGIVKLQYGDVYHVAFVEEIRADGIYISEQNYSKDPDCPITYRVLDFLDPHIIGFTRTGYSNEPPEI